MQRVRNMSGKMLKVLKLISKRVKKKERWIKEGKKV